MRRSLNADMSSFQLTAQQMHFTNDMHSHFCSLVRSLLFPLAYSGFFTLSKSRVRSFLVKLTHGSYITLGSPQHGVSFLYIIYKLSRANKKLHTMFPSNYYQYRGGGGGGGGGTKKKKKTKGLLKYHQKI